MIFNRNCEFRYSDFINVNYVVAKNRTCIFYSKSGEGIRYVCVCVCMC